MLSRILRKVTLGTILVLLLAAGCRKQTDYDELPVPVAAQLHEVFHEQQRAVSIFFCTIEEYPCGNFQIIYSFEKDHGNLEVDFKGLYLPSICVTVIGPATGELILDDLEPGAWPVTFSYNQQELQAVVHLSKDEFRVEMTADNPELLIFRDMAINRVPSDYIWGSLRPLEESSDDQGELFFQQMASAGAQRPQLEDAHYGFFRVSDGEVWLDPYDEGPADKVQTFVFSWTEDMQTLEQITSEFSASHEIQVFSARGDVMANQEEDSQ
ncbi:MAG: hypothetical protein R6U64_01025 [Bacteroidales bacterium]